MGCWLVALPLSHPGAKVRVRCRVIPGTKLTPIRCDDGNSGMRGFSGALALLVVMSALSVGARAAAPGGQGDAPGGAQGGRHDGLVAACRALDDPDTAETACRAALDSGAWPGKDGAWAWNNLGLALMAQRRWLAAIEAFDAALVAVPEYAPALSNRGNVHAALGDMQRALADHSRAVELDPSYVAALHNRAVDHEEMGNHRAALADYRAVIKLDPAHAGARIGLASASCKLGRVKASAKARLEAVNGGYIDAVAMQELLKRSGFYRGPIDGIFGKGSRAALRAWTRRGCLPPA